MICSIQSLCCSDIKPGVFSFHTTKIRKNRMPTFLDLKDRKIDKRLKARKAFSLTSIVGLTLQYIHRGGEKEIGDYNFITAILAAAAAQYLQVVYQLSKPKFAYMLLYTIFLVCVNVINMPQIHQFISKPGKITLGSISYGLFAISILLNTIEYVDFLSKKNQEAILKNDSQEDVEPDDESINHEIFSENFQQITQDSVIRIFRSISDILGQYSLILIQFALFYFRPDLDSDNILILISFIFCIFSFSIKIIESGYMFFLYSQYMKTKKYSMLINICTKLLLVALVTNFKYLREEEPKIIVTTLLLIIYNITAWIDIISPVIITSSN